MRFKAGKLNLKSIITCTGLIANRNVSSIWRFVLFTGLIVGCGTGSAPPQPAIVPTDSMKLGSGAHVSSPGPAAEPAKRTTESAIEPTVESARFINVASQAGLTAVLHCGGKEKDHILESVGSGCAWVDVDQDGLLDVFLVNAWTLEDNPRKPGIHGSNVLYRNLGQGRFADITATAGLASEEWGCGVCAADFDNDGLVDLFVTNFGPNRLYRNRGDGSFEDVTQRANLSAPGWNSGAAFFDADGDGWLDLYLVRYIDCTMEDVLAGRRTNLWRDAAKVMVGPFGMSGGRDLFFRNNRDGTFSDATEEVGMTDTAESYGLGVLASDLDGDGDVDVYVGNDSNPNFLYRNDGNGKFTEIGGWCGAGVSGDGRPQASMGVDAGDLDGDGLPELVTTNFAYDYSTVYKNEGQLFFTDISPGLRMKDFTYVPVSWGTAFLDFDLDTQLDLLVLNGHIYPQVDALPSLKESYRQLPVLLRQVNGKFQDVSREAGPGLQQAESMRGLAVGDYDNDGKPDLLITAIDSPPLLLHNEAQTAGYHWSIIRLLNRHGSPAINAVARLTTPGGAQWREVRSGSTYCSQSSFDLSYGLKTANQVSSLEIRWPSGQKTLVHDLPSDQVLTFREPSRPEDQQ